MLKRISSALQPLVASKYSLIALLTLVLMLLSAYGITVILSSHEKSLINDTIRKSEFLSQAVEKRVQLDLLLSDTTSLSNIKNQVLSSNKDLIGIGFYKDNLEHLYGERPLNTDIFKDSVTTFNSLRVKDQVYVLHRIEDNLSNTIGYTLMVSSLEEVNDRLNAIRIRFSFIAMVLIVTVVLIGLWAIRNISNTTKRETISRLKMESAERNTALQQKFLSSMSHELRTPLNAISGFCKLLYDEQQTDSGQKYLTFIKESADTMEYLVNDILDYSKISQDKISFNPVTFCIKSLYERTISIFQNRVPDNVSFEFTPLNDTTPVVGDINRIRQILINLINNAIKYTNNGSIDINLNAIKKDTVYEIFFSIKDTGIGIPADKKDIIFQPFTQAHDTKKYKVESTGLGLSICKRLIEMMDGTIGFESEINKGSHFYFTISLPIGDIDKCINPSSFEQKSITVNSNILVVEDTRLNQILLEKILSKWNANITVVGNGLEAVNIIKEKSFDIILMDIQMPIMGGIEAARKIKEIQPSIPIIALTANAGKENETLYLNKGMDGFVSKPFNPNILALELAKFVPVSFSTSN